MDIFKADVKRRRESKVRICMTVPHSSSQFPKVPPPPLSLSLSVALCVSRFTSNLFRNAYRHSSVARTRARTRSSFKIKQASGEAKGATPRPLAKIT